MYIFPFQVLAEWKMRFPILIGRSYKQAKSYRCCPGKQMESNCLRFVYVRERKRSAMGNESAFLYSSEKSLKILTKE